MAKNKWSLYSFVAGRWMHIFSYPTKAEAENNRKFYKHNHPGHRTRVVPVGTQLNK